MTIYGWDMSHYDWDRGLTAAEIRAAPGHGIAFMTHKIGEGDSYNDPRFDDFWRAASGMRDRVLLGAYYVNHPGDQAPQVDRFLSLLDTQAPGWRTGPFILQVDAERFGYMPREPNLAEIKSFVARLRAKAPRHRPIVYAPRWVYGDRLRGLDAPLWASNYGSNPSQVFRAAYPGDGSLRWDAYSGQTPAILQYGSRLRVGMQSTCDANAFRGTLAELISLVYQGIEEEDNMPTPKEIADAVLGRRYYEYVDEDGDRQREARTVSDILYATHRAAVGARAEVTALRGVVQDLSAVIRAGGGSVDTAAILAGVDKRLAALPSAADIADAVVDEIAS